MSNPMRHLILQHEAAAYCKISVESLKKWTESGHAPHVMIDGEGPYYTKTALLGWVKENLINNTDGMPIPKRLQVLLPPADRIEGGVPIEISAIPTLCELQLSGESPGVYFLCDKGAVVYVGQSICVIGRVGTHVHQGIKKFDKAYFLPCPKEELDSIEIHFIRELNPKYNGGFMGANTKRKRIQRDAVLSEYGIGA